MQYNVAKFEIQDLLPIAMTFVVAGIGIAYSLNIMGDVKSDMTANTAEANATQKAIEGVAKIPAKFPLLVNVVIAAIILGVLVRYLMVRYN